MRYSLVRTSDGAGDSGPMSCGIHKDEATTKFVYEQNCRPRVGIAMQVGSIYARTYSEQDYWQTTYIVEILEDTPDMIRFKTGNSEYVWKQF